MANQISSWHDIPWKLYLITVRQLQDEIVKAEMNDNRNKVYKLQRKLVCSIEGRAVAVRNTTTNDGGKTPGVDGIIWDSPKKRLDAIAELRKIVQSPRKYKALPVRRVLIPKPETDETRPLGIPTMIDRAVQSLYLLAVDPVVECQSDLHSYGFRVYKSTHEFEIFWLVLMDPSIFLKQM